MQTRNTFSKRNKVSKPQHKTGIIKQYSKIQGSHLNNQQGKQIRKKSPKQNKYGYFFNLLITFFSF